MFCAIYVVCFLIEKEGGSIEDAVERGENKRGKKLSEIIVGCKVRLDVLKVKHVVVIPITIATDFILF